MSVALRYDLGELGNLETRLRMLPGALNRVGLMEALTIEGESQTRRRISEEKYSPDGEQWPGWLESYAKTRHGGHSLLENEGDLLDSITAFVDGMEGGWGSNMVYAATHQFGDEERNIAAREYLGVSDENAEDLLAVANDWIGDRMRGWTQ